MAYQLTLPSLQASLDRLQTARTLSLAAKQIDLLFGTDDDARVARLKRFARGHDCAVSYTDNCVTFHKLPVLKPGVPAPIS